MLYYNKAPHLPLYNPDIFGSLLKQASLFWLLDSGFRRLQDGTANEAALFLLDL